MGSQPQLIQSEKKLLTLGQIVGFHKAIEEFRKTLNLPPLSKPHVRDFDMELLVQYMSMNPLKVTRSRGKYRCVGNIRLWELCRAWMEPETRVPVEVFHGKQNSKAFICNYALELIYPHIVYRLAPEDAVAISKLLTEFPLDVLPNPVFPSKAACARAMGISKRRLADV